MTEYDAPAVEELGDVARLTETFGYSGHGKYDKDWKDHDDPWWLW